MENWRRVWRSGFAKVIPPAGLEALARALADDDQRLLQQLTTSPPPLMCVQDWPCEAADAIAFAAWQGEHLATVGEVTDAFARYCFECDKRLGVATACRWFLTWHDDTPRAEMRRELLAEVEEALSELATPELAEAA
jgi:hypothetical protein